MLQNWRKTTVESLQIDPPSLRNSSNWKGRSVCSLNSSTVGLSTSSETMVRTENHPHRAVALTYQERNMATPIVSGSACGELAAMMIKVARRYGVPVSCDQSLTEKLVNLPISQEIPGTTYEEVARLFCEVSKISRNK